MQKFMNIIVLNSQTNYKSILFKTVETLFLIPYLMLYTQIICRFQINKNLQSVFAITSLCSQKFMFIIIKINNFYINLTNC